MSIRGGGARVSAWPACRTENGSAARSFAAEAHLLLHGPGPARIQPNTRLRRELCVQLAGSPRFVSVCQSPLCIPPLSNLTGESPYKRLYPIGNAKFSRQPLEPGSFD